MQGLGFGQKGQESHLHQCQSFPRYPQRLNLSVKMQRGHIFKLVCGSMRFDPDPPALDPLEHGWKACEEEKTLMPAMVPAGVKIAPPEILKMIKCS